MTHVKSVKKFSCEHLFLQRICLCLNKAAFYPEKLSLLMDFLLSQSTCDFFFFNAVTLFSVQSEVTLFRVQTSNEI